MEKKDKNSNKMRRKNMTEIEGSCKCAMKGVLYKVCKTAMVLIQYKDGLRVKTCSRSLNSGWKGCGTLL